MKKQEIVGEIGILVLGIMDANHVGHRLMHMKNWTPYDHNQHSSTLKFMYMYESSHFKIMKNGYRGIYTRAEIQKTIYSYHRVNCFVKFDGLNENNKQNKTKQKTMGNINKMQKYK